MTDAPTPQQALILWCLLGRGGTALQGTLVPEVKKADREALVAGRYITVEKQGRALRLTVTDKGWNWAGSHMGAPLPPAFQALQAWLGRIGADLAASGRLLADFVGPVPDEPSPAPARTRKKAAGDSRAKAPAASKKAASPEKPPNLKQLRARIEEAYLALTGGKRAESVRLSALRAQLSDLDQATVDRGLAAILKKDKTARLSKFSDPRSLDDAEREAAFSPAGEPFHILRIQS